MLTAERSQGHEHEENVVVCVEYALTWEPVVLVPAEWEGGRPGAEGFRVGAAVGRMNKLRGRVHETKRSYQGRDEQRTEYELLLESFSMEEFGLDTGTQVAGLRFDLTRRFFEMGLVIDRLNPSAGEVARRDYYPGVKSFDFEGYAYDYFSSQRMSLRFNIEQYDKEVDFEIG